MRRSSYSPEPDCAIAQSLGVVGDGWELLIVRDLARGLDRFELLAESLRISRKVLTERLSSLLDSGIVERVAYQERPTRHAYKLTPRGRALLPVLVALQDWGDRWLLGDGELTGTNADADAPTHRIHELVGQRIPDGLVLPVGANGRHVTAHAESANAQAGGASAKAGGGRATASAEAGGGRATAGGASAEAGGGRAGTGGAGAEAGGEVVLRDVVDAGATATVIFGYPATGRPSKLPDGWDNIAGTAGCTLENKLFAERAADFTAAGIAIHGVSTQRPDEQQTFAELENVPHMLLSDTELTLTAALRLPTFRAGGYERLKRLMLIVAPTREIKAVHYPITNIPAAIDWALRTASA